MVGYRVRQPARLVVQTVVLRDQPHGNGASDTTVHNRHLEGGEQGTVSTEGRWELLGCREGELDIEGAEAQRDNRLGHQRKRESTQGEDWGSGASFTVMT